MIDALILAPYYWTLKIRHALYDKGVKKSREAEVPTICVGNVTVGGTGKTPHTEMILRILLSSEEYKGKNIAVLSLGYKRKSKGFQNVTLDGSALLYGDEPMQIKKKFPGVTVAVCKDRVLGCRFLCHPEEIEDSRKGRKCKDRNFPPADIIILDDAYQYRKLRSKASILLVNYNRPVHKDHLMPLGKLRDLPSRMGKADAVIVSKCPPYMEKSEKDAWAKNLGFKDYDILSCSGTGPCGARQYLFFSTLEYCQMEPVFVESESRYLYSPRLILFSGIADDSNLVAYLSDKYKIVRHFNFPDHHTFSNADIASLNSASNACPTAVFATTEKDGSRIKDVKNMPERLRQRMFRVPVRAVFTSDLETSVFNDVIKSFIER